MSHIPVLMDEVLHALSPKDGEQYVDGTFGAGGYTSAILKAAKCHVTGLDRDPNVRSHVERIAGAFPDSFAFQQIEFSKMAEVFDVRSLDGIVLDVGVSSMQLDQGERGFSFMREGPLDMRMSGHGPRASDVINNFEHKELVEVFKAYGEERRAKRCADYIMRARGKSAIDTTQELADIITNALGKSGKKHPATRVFQALRIYINDELGELYRALIAAESILKPGGRLVVVSFHSLEDRIVKSFLRARCGDVISGSRYLPPQDINTAKPPFKLTKRSGVKASKMEQSQNPRSRSACLRSGIRTHADNWPVDEDSGVGFIVPDVPSLAALESRLV